jgi:hypothetical protein
MKIRLYIHITVNTIAKYFVYFTGSKQLISTRMIDVKVCIRPKYAFFYTCYKFAVPPRNRNQFGAAPYEASCAKARRFSIYIKFHRHVMPDEYKDTKKYI